MSQLRVQIPVGVTLAPPAGYALILFQRRKCGTKVTLPLIPDFYQKSLRTKVRLKILELNSRKKYFDPHSVLGEKSFQRIIFCKTFLIFLGMVAHLGVGSNGILTVALKRNLMARRRHLCFAQKYRADM